MAIVALDSLEACSSDSAKTFDFEEPASAADSAAHQATARYCSADTPTATIALTILDLNGGSQGKLKVAALDPTDPDSSRVIESNEVVYNGGVEGNYPPTVLHATSVHQSIVLRVTAVGSDLQLAQTMSLMGTDSTWTLPLSITAKSAHAITGVASVAALMPACEVSVSWEDGSAAPALLGPDSDPGMPEINGCQSVYIEDLLEPHPSMGFAVLPKDFALVRGFVDETTSNFALHLFYIRKNLWCGFRDLLPVISGYSCR